jgi:hypothetical protein
VQNAKARNVEGSGRDLSATKTTQNHAISHKTRVTSQNPRPKPHEKSGAYTSHNPWPITTNLAPTVK